MSKPGLTVSQFARKFSKCEMTVYRLIEKKHLLAVKYADRDTRIPIDELERYIKYGIRTDQSGGICEYAESEQSAI